MKLVTAEDFHQKVLECFAADDLTAALDYIEMAENIYHDMSFERELLDNALDAAVADYKGNRNYDEVTQEIV